MEKQTNETSVKFEFDFDSSLAMIIIYLNVKAEVDREKGFQVRAWKQHPEMDIWHINLIGVWLCASRPTIVLEHCDQ